MDAASRAYAKSHWQATRGRWMAMWEPWSRRFSAYFAADPDRAVRVRAKTPEELWNCMVAADPVLIGIAMRALPAQRMLPSRK
ncbi:hypothetical protein ACOZ38_28545 [Sphaerisporangium viridialbum]|uniref:hypothetical protein n=1 Tax=Sphaerisporangium viridialbum TaxID=46189 RepID=UPI003C7730C2